MENTLKKQHYFYITIGLICGILSYPVAAELKIGFVNALKVMDQAPQVNKANKRLEREFAPKQRRLISAGQEIKKLEERLAKNIAIMSESAARKLNRDIRDKKREAKREQEEFREDYNIRRNEELDKIQKIIIEVIQELANEHAYDMIITEGIVWASSRVDITDKVLRRLKVRKRR